MLRRNNDPYGDVIPVHHLSRKNLNNFRPKTNHSNKPLHQNLQENTSKSAACLSKPSDGETCDQGLKNSDERSLIISLPCSSDLEPNNYHLL
ncbi:hypothetical protein Trydic_g16506 [Trypoxylus dichotomus]